MVSPIISSAWALKYILVSSATRDGRRISAVTIHDPCDWQDHTQLLETGFSRYSVRPVIKQGELVGTLEVVGGETKQIQVLAAEDFSYALAKEENPQLALPGPGFVYAPAVEGADAGFAYVLVEGNAIGKFPVVYGQTVEMKTEEKKPFWKRA